MRRTEGDIRTFLKDLPEVPEKTDCYEIRKFSTVYSREPIYILKNCNNNVFLKLNRYDHFLWNQINGRTHFNQFFLLFSKEFGKLPYEYISRFLHKLCLHGFIPNSHIKKTEQKGSILEIKIPLQWLSKFMRDCYHLWGKYLYNWLSLMIIAITCLLGTGFILFYSKETVSSPAKVNYFYLALTCILPIILHEMSHAFTCLYYKRDICDSGLMFYMLLPALYVNTSDIWMEGRIKRFNVSLSGPICDLLMGSLLLLLSFLWPNGSFYFKLGSLLAFTRAMFNFNPL